MSMVEENTLIYTFFTFSTININKQKFTPSKDHFNRNPCHKIDSLWVLMTSTISYYQFLKLMKLYINIYINYYILIYNIYLCHI